MEMTSMEMISDLAFDMGLFEIDIELEGETEWEEMVLELAS